MKAVREIGSNIIVYLFEDQYSVRITEQGLIGPVMAFDIKPETHEVIDVPTPPMPFVGGKLVYNDTWLYDELENAKADLWIKVKNIRSIKESAGCMTALAKRVQTDDKSKQLINGLVTMALLALQASQPFEVGFTMEDNSIEILDAMGAIGLGQAVGLHVSRVYTRSFELRASIDAATTLEELEAINIDSDWDYET